MRIVKNNILPTGPATLNSRTYINLFNFESIGKKVGDIENTSTIIYTLFFSLNRYYLLVLPTELYIVSFSGSD